MSLSRRSVTSSAYTISANAVQLVVMVGRSILLARLLAPEVFGVYAFASSIVALSRALPSFGLSGAYLHRTAESESDLALTVHFTLTLILSTGWAVVLIVAAAIFASGETRYAIWVIAITTLILQLTTTPQILLTRRVMFRRLAALQATTVLATTAAAMALAWRGFGLWSLLATDIVGAIVAVILLYAFRPVWRPRIGWSAPTVRYFVRFGSKVVLGQTLFEALDRVDDLWTGVALGDTALGFYSKAYQFANYPRMILANPLNGVAMGAYSELQGDRQRLSKVFFRVNALLIRSSFLLAGLLALVAPEFIRILLGDKWLPMLDAFRLMLIYTLLNPIKITVSNVIGISGAPGRVARARAVQLVVLVTGCFLLGPGLGIAGVAIAVDLMLVLGMAILFWEARSFVDFSLMRLFSVPAVALVLGMAAAWAALSIPGVMGSDWRTAAVKIVMYTVVYGGLMLILERDQVPVMLDIFKQLRPKRVV
jgi:O-antigen/teichoic acid export membrane protein